MTNPQSADAGNVVSLPTLEQRWDKVQIRLAPDRPRIPAGEYEATTTGLRYLDKKFDRPTIEFLFTVYEGRAGDSRVLAVLPMWIPLPTRGGALSPNCRLSRMFALLELVRRDKFRPSDCDVLRGKVWKISVSDTKYTTSGKLKNPKLSYSVVREVLDRA